MEIALLVDIARRCSGSTRIAQVDLGVRVHRHHDDRRLGRMAAEILHTALDRLARRGDLRTDLELVAPLTQFDRDGSGFSSVTHDVARLERPPMRTVPEYAHRSTP